jgi:hypothetical protein
MITISVSFSTAIESVEVFRETLIIGKLIRKSERIGNIYMFIYALNLVKNVLFAILWLFLQA